MHGMWFYHYVNKKQSRFINERCSHDSRQKMIMLWWCFIVLSSSTYVSSSTEETWPFMLVDKYVEEFKSHVDTLERSAFDYQFQQENFVEKEYDEVAAIKHASHYDFIIVGGGTSGSVLASRLSEIPEWKILLLESGGPETVATKIPKNWEVIRNTPYNWGYVTTPQNYSCASMAEHRCIIPSGRILGGNSATNNMVYTRGNPRDYDLWADLGNKGWCFADALPFFKKIEDANFEPFDKKFHHRGGPIHLQHPQYLTHLAEHALHAGEELGLHTIDYNGKKQLGIGIPQLMTKCGKRFSTADAYLEPTVKRNNLVIKPLSHVVKILISPHTKEVQGVQYVHKGKLFVAKAEKEVILAAGALSTPKLLILSGIGPKEECERLHIENLADLKVGHNLKIRPTFIGLDFIYNESKIENYDDYHKIFNYLKYGTGPLTSPNVEAIAYIKTEVSKNPVPYPDIELQFITKPNTLMEHYKWLKLSEEDYHALWKHMEGHKSVKILVTLNHPVSTGFVKLHDSDPFHYPIIEPHFLADEDEIDYHTLLAGIHKAIKLTETAAFQKLGITFNHHAVHGCEEIPLGTEEYWKCAIKHLVVATEDASGTARMGPHTDTDAVVDNELKVYGIHKLRVADASVIPVSITGNLVAPSIMIGEKAAHLIIENWK